MYFREERLWPMKSANLAGDTFLHGYTKVGIMQKAEGRLCLEGMNIIFFNIVIKGATTATPYLSV